MKKVDTNKRSSQKLGASTLGRRRFLGASAVVGAGLSIPLWQQNYADGIHAFKADANAQRAQRRANNQRLIAELEAAYASLRSSVRRVKLYKDTLVPQAEAAYASVLGSYASGRASLAQTLLAQQTLLELHVEEELVHAQYARTFASLERIVGQSLLTQGDQDEH